MRVRNYRLFSPQYLLAIITFGLSFGLFPATGLAQQKVPDNLPVAELAKDPAKSGVAPARVAVGNDLYCAGYIRSIKPIGQSKIIGGEEENRLAHFGQGDVVYLDAGGSLQPGTLLTITRPMGKFNSPYPRVGGKALGIYVRELGVLRVMAVQGQTATARIIFSCDDIQLGDLLVGFETRRAPETDVREPLPRYQSTSGQKNGRIVLQREQREIIAPRDVVYVDLGTESGVRVGEKFTIFRHQADDANIFKFNDDDIVLRQSSGYEGDKFKGGKYSNDHPYEARQKVKNTRPTVPQKIVGELVVIAVQGKSATAIVTRTTQEVHTGDYIETAR